MTTIERDRDEDDDLAEICWECGGEGGWNICQEDCCPAEGGEDGCTDPACWRHCSGCGGHGVTMEERGP